MTLIGKAFLDMTPKVKVTTKNKADFINIKTFCVSHNIKKVQRHTQWEKILASHTSHKGVISRIINNFCNSIIKSKTTYLKMGKLSEYTFLQRGYTNGQ